MLDALRAERKLNMLGGLGIQELGLLLPAALPSLLIVAALVVIAVKTVQTARAVDEISSSMRAVNRQLQKIAGALGEPEARQGTGPERPQSE